MSENNIPEFGFIPEGTSPAFEIINYLKSKLKAKILEYEDIIKEKDEMIKSLNDEIKSLKDLLDSTRRSYEETQKNILDQNKELFLKIEESKQILLKQKEKHQKEVVLLKEIFERTRNDLKMLSEELETLKNEREKLKKEVLELTTEKTNISDKLRLLENQLSQSKKAIEETLSELFGERKKNDELIKKINELTNVNEDLKKRLETTISAWNNEREQWKEMWEREKAMWESHRMEFSVWEERLRSEREAWLKAVREEESKGMEGVKMLGNVLSEASKWSYKLTEVLKLYANKQIMLPHIFSSEKVIEKKIGKARNTIFGISLISIIILSTVFYFFKDYSSKLRFSKIASYRLDDTNYTGFVKKGRWFIFSHFSKGIVFKDENLNTLSTLDNFGDIKPRITAISLEGYNLWTLDLSGLRFIKIDPDSGKILKIIKTAGVAPQGVSSDGIYLWSFDAVAGVLYRYELNGDIKGVSSYSLDGVKTIDWLGWRGDKLYVLSNSKLYRFKYVGDRFEKISLQNAKNFVYCYLYNDEFYALKDLNGAKELEVLKIKNKE